MTTPRTKINRNDLQFFPSERLTDNDDGGGMPLGTPISGESNELFNPISSIARVNGAFFARLVYMGVLRADDEPLFGSYAAITKPPKDDTVSYLLFRATKFGELRSEILKRIEAYSVGTIESRMTLLSTQSQNSRLIQAYQRIGEPLPLVGDVLCLRQDKAGYAKHEQYVQVTRVTSEDRTFTVQSSSKDFTRTVVQMEISSKLEADFVGVNYPVEGYADSPCKIRETNIADAAQYYGIKPLAAAIAAESQTVQVTSLMEKIVPTNQVETRLNDLSAGGQRQTLFDGSKTGTDGLITLNVSKSHGVGTTTSLYIGNAAIPGSVVIETSNGQIKDKGNTLMLADVAVGSIQHSAGEMIINAPNYTGLIQTVSFRAAGAELQVADTTKLLVNINNRGYNWAANINPAPAVGSLTVSYRAQGRWYDLRDDGTGTLRGASAAHGSGSVNFVSGTVSISCGELPDVGSAILLSWGTRARYFNRAGGNATAKMTLDLAQSAVPASLSLTWNDGAPKTAVSDSKGNITGDWTGKYDAKTRQILIDTNAQFNHPVGVLDIKASYSTGKLKSTNISLSALDDDGNTTFTIANFLPNTLNISYAPVIPPGYTIINNQVNEQSVRDDGAGNLINAKGVTVGVIDYETGAGKFNPSFILNLAKARYIYSRSAGQAIATGAGTIYIEGQQHVEFNGYEYHDVEVTMNVNGDFRAWGSWFESDTASAVVENLSSGNIEVNLLPTYAEVVTPASINFKWSGKTYFDRNGGLYTDLDPKTGAATMVGSVDYQSGSAILTNWQWTNGSAPVLTSLVTSLGGNPVDTVTFRTPSSPLRPGQLNVRATDINGVQLSATANLSGELSGTGITGYVDAEYGVVDVQFGSWVTATGNENEPWYSAEAVTEGKIWQPRQVFAETITYNATSYSYLPIDSTVVKIDTVRLPQDGRIPIFRRGDTIIIGNRKTDDIGSAHTGGQTVQLSRTDVDRICVSDADDKPVNAELWDYDLDAGSITWKTPLDLSMYKMPLSVMHAQEERNRILKADIDGTLTLIFPVKRDYPIEDTYVSSVLIGGDLQVRVSIPFTQRSWDNVWRDEPKGDQLLNKLNLKDYPMVLTDDGAIQERWMIKMTGTNQFELYGETLGFVMRDDTLTDLTPINPATDKPYFTLPKEAFGADAPWASQDIIRFNTWGTLMPTWVLCAVQPSSTAPVGEDGFTQCLYGDTTELIV